MNVEGRRHTNLSKKEGVVLVGIEEDDMFLCQKSVLGR